MQPIAERYIGSPIKRSEDTRILTGRGRYVDDVALPGMLHAAFVRSPFAHARITGVEDRGGPPGPRRRRRRDRRRDRGADHSRTDRHRRHDGRAGRCFTLLCTDKVRLVGDPVVIVVAESRYQAEDACELVEVDYDDLPAVASAEVALDPDSPPIFEDLGSNVLVETAAGRLRRRGRRLRPGRPGRPRPPAPAPPPERAHGGPGYRRQLRPRDREADRPLPPPRVCTWSASTLADRLGLRAEPSPGPGRGHRWVVRAQVRGQPGGDRGRGRSRSSSAARSNGSRTATKT